MVSHVVIGVGDFAPAYDAVARAHGGACEGPPGTRPAYHADDYGAYFRDPDGNKLCVVCHDAQPPRETGNIF